ncbi:MAG: HXXEE domain-containing protein [Flavobacteriaceae bacterium]
MDLKLSTLIWMLPFAFALHNLEEIFGMEKWTKSIPSFIHKPVTTRQFGVAVTLFTVLGFVIVFAKGFYQTEKQYHFAIAAFAGMLWLNVFLPHLFATLYLKKYAPGVITGLVLNLPLATLILLKMDTNALLTLKELFFAIMIGGIIGIALAGLFLKIGRVLGF